MSETTDQGKVSNKDTSAQAYKLEMTGSSKADSADSTDGEPKKATEENVDAPRFSTTHPARNDVLFGRGRPLQSHTGNIRFHSILNRYRRQYKESHERHERSDIVVRILLEVATPERVAIPATRAKEKTVKMTGGRAARKGGDKGRTHSTPGDEEQKFVVLPGGKFLKRRSEILKKDIMTEKKKPPVATEAAKKGQNYDEPAAGDGDDGDGDGDGNTDDGACSSTVMTASTSVVSAPTSAAAASILTSLAGKAKSSSSAAAEAERGLKDPPMGGHDEEGSVRSTQSSVPQIVDREDVSTKVTTMNVGSGRMNVGPKDNTASTPRPSSITDVSDVSNGNKYVLANSTFGGVVWEEVPINEGTFPALILCIYLARRIENRAVFMRKPHIEDVD